MGHRKQLGLLEKEKVMNKFYKNTVKNPNNGCIEWISTIGIGGYGKFYENGKTKGAHRKSWELANGKEIPDGMNICHHCDNPKCVNPEHLFLGTQADNVRDMMEKGRYRHYNSAKEKNGMWKNRKCAAKGVDAPAAKLDPVKVAEIVDLLLAGHSHASIAARYGVTRSAIGLINTGKNWIEVIQELPAYQSIVASRKNKLCKKLFDIGQRETEYKNNH